MTVHKLVTIALLVCGSAYFILERGPEGGLSSALSSGAGGSGDAALAAAFEDRRSDLQVQSSGRVVRILPDDDSGSRHQRFILKLESGQTLLVSHNIDLAPRIQDLAVGDEVSFFGEYEWNPQGGVIHWTHHDPDGRHADGWLKRQGTTYQ